MCEEETKDSEGLVVAGYVAGTARGLRTLCSKLGSGSRRRQAGAPPQELSLSPPIIDRLKSELGLRPVFSPTLCRVLDRQLNFLLLLSVLRRMLILQVSLLASRSDPLGDRGTWVLLSYSQGMVPKVVDSGPF